MPATLTVHKGDITELEVDAIVNAANTELKRGGGVCGAIFAAAGPGLQEECDELGECVTGEAVITSGYGLAPAMIVHTVGPVWQGGIMGESAFLSLCYARSLALAADFDCRSIAFPAISTGVYGFPAEEAARIAVKTVSGVIDSYPGITDVIFCCFDQASADLHRAALDALPPPRHDA